VGEVHPSSDEEGVKQSLTEGEIIYEK